jgi:hypothetical protein
MKIQSLQFTADKKNKNLLRCNLDVSHSESLTKLKQDIELPIAYLICSDDLSRLKEEFRDAIIDCGIKKPHIELWRCFKKELTDKVQIIEAAYNAPGSAKKSISAFLFKSRDLLNVYIIGAKKDIFDDLWRDWEDPEKRNAQEKGTKTRKSYPDIDDADETACQLLNDLADFCNVPPQLEEKFVGASWKVDLVRKFIILAAQRDVPVLILGDTGTGKEIVARSIHDEGRKDKPYYIINCGGIPTELLESELFGYEPNCFTGAGPKVKKGLWELADKGTLFLDEIGDLQPSHQVKILRAIENGTIRRLCGTVDIKVNARIIAATNRDLASMVQKGHFREDLYYRLRGFLIHTPALKDHPEDIPLLANYFWQRITNGRTKCDNKSVKAVQTKRLPQSIMEELRLYRWPGNARELKMVLNHLYAMFGSDGLQEKHLKEVFYLQGQNWSTQTGPMSERGIDLLLGDCWRHLRRADDVIRALEYILVPVMEGKKADINAVTSARTYLEFHLGELTILCREHMLFHSEKTFSSVLRFKEKLNHFHNLMHDNLAKAQEYWKVILAEEFKTVLSIIFKEVENVLGKYKMN